MEARQRQVMGRERPLAGYLWYMQQAIFGVLGALRVLAVGVVAPVFSICAWPFLRVHVCVCAYVCRFLHVCACVHAAGMAELSLVIDSHFLPLLFLRDLLALLVQRDGKGRREPR